MLKLHLGCGDILLEGWLNLDNGGPRGTPNPLAPWQYRDLTLPFPERDNTVDYIFCEHFLEHITRDQGLALLKECRRVLKPQGALRIITPDLETIFEDWAAGKLDRVDRSVWAPATACQMVNEAMRNWGHQFIYDNQEIRLICTEAAFDLVQTCEYKKSIYPELHGIDQRPHAQEIIVEATKH